MEDKTMIGKSDVFDNQLLPKPGWSVAQYGEGIILLILACWILFAQLDSPLLEPDESRYAEIPRLMVRSGDWMTPKLQGKAYNDKPPLVYWLIAAGYCVFGVSIESARLVPATAGFLTLIIVYIWSRRYLGRYVANATVLILMTMLGYVAFMRMLLLDGVLAFLVVGSLLSGHHALAQRRHQGWWIVSAILCGLGVLAKGPVAIVLVTPCLFALRWLDRSTTPMRFVDAVSYGMVVLALAVPWYAVMMLTNEGFGSEHFIRHHFQRFLEPAHHERPFWFYLPTLILELLPWPVLLVAIGQRWRAWTGEERFLICFSLLCFLFFSIARAKLPTYLLPILPILAVLFGKQLQLSVTSFNSASRMQLTILITSLVMLFIISFRSFGYHWVLDETPAGIDAWGLTALVTLCGIALAAWVWRDRFAISTVTLRGGLTAVTALIAILIYTHRAIPDYARMVSVVEPCQRMIALADQEGIPYVAHRNSWDAVSFMLNDEELEVFSSREIPAFLTWINNHPRSMIWMREYEKRVEAFTKTLPSGIEVEKVYNFGRMQALILRHTTQVTSNPPR